MNKEMLNILNDLSKRETTNLALNVMELTADNLAKDQEIERLNNIINETREEIDNWEKLLETGLRKNGKKICISTAKNMLFFIKSKLEGEKNDK